MTPVELEPLRKICKRVSKYDELQRQKRRLEETMRDMEQWGGVTCSSTKDDPIDWPASFTGISKTIELGISWREFRDVLKSIVASQIQRIEKEIEEL